MKSRDRKPTIPHPWVPSWAHHGPQGLFDFIARQNERLKRAGKQRRVRVT